MAKRKLNVWAWAVVSALLIAAAVVSALLIAAAVVGAPRVQARAAQDTLTVTQVSEGFIYEDDATKDTVTGFALPSTVTGYFELVFPASVQTIEAGAFDAETYRPLSTRLLAVDAHGVTNIMPQAFGGCQSLVEICVSESVVNGIAGSGLTDPSPTGNRRRMSIVTRPQDKSLHIEHSGNDSYLFVRNGEASSTDWTLLAYEGSSTALTLPDASLCVQSLAGASAETYAVGEQAFTRSALTAVNIPACVTELGDNAFSGCTSLATLTLSEGVTNIGGSTFYGTGVTGVTIPASCTEVGINAFGACASLTRLDFAERTRALLMRHHAFAGCSGLTCVVLPADVRTTVRQYAFSDCTSLSWVYAGTGTIFENASKLDGDPSAVFFPTTNTNLTVIFPDKASYDAMEANTEKTFYTKHGKASTYIVEINRYIGAEETPTRYLRLHGKTFAYVQNDETGGWATDTAYATLPAQAAHYASTVYYTERELQNVIDFAGVNARLAADTDVVNLYCYETIAKPTLPTEPSSWVYDSDKSYDVADISQVLAALGCKAQYTQAQLSAIDYKVVYADRDSKVGATPDKIKGEGAYSVTFTLDPAYGAWTSGVDGSVTVNVDTKPFNAILIVFLVIGILAVAVTAVTAVLRQRVQARARKKQLSSKEVIEKFRAVGGETDLK